MRAVKLALFRFHIPPHSSVLVATDNTTVVTYMNKVGGQDLGPSGERQIRNMQLSFVSVSQSVPGLCLAR